MPFCIQSKSLYRSSWLLDICHLLNFAICPMWMLKDLAFILKVKHEVRVFKNKVLLKIFDIKGDEISGKWRRLYNSKLHAQNDNFIIFFFYYNVMPCISSRYGILLWSILLRRYPTLSPSILRSSCTSQRGSFNKNFCKLGIVVTWWSYPPGIGDRSSHSRSGHRLIFP